VLYDAFFKHQRKPKMTGLGELYYEGKEYEAQLEHLKAGVLSEELREALGMGDNTPPPWLVNMQVCVRGGGGRELIAGFGLCQLACGWTVSSAPSYGRGALGA
jgi:hypothetical protein